MESGLVSVTIPEGVQTIGDYAFSYCYKLKSVSIPSTLTRAGAYIFDESDNLINIYYNGTQEQWDHLHINIPDEATVHCKK